MINNIIMDMINYNSHDARRIGHALKVHSYAKMIAEEEKINSDELFILEISSILHDIGIKECEKKYNRCGGFLQQKEGPLVAKKILLNYNLDDKILERVLYLIAHHHTFKNVVGMDYQILLEADLIVNAQEEYITEYAFRNAAEKLFVTDTGKSIAMIAL